MAEDIASEPSASPWAVCKEMFNASPGLSKRLISQTLLLTASRGCVAWGAYLVSKAVDAGALGSSPGVAVAGGAAALFAVSKIVEWALVSLHSSLHARFVLPAAHDFCDKALSCALRSKRLTGCDPVEMARRLDRKMEARNLLGSLFHHIGPPAMEALLCSAVLASMGFGVLAWALIPAAALHVWMGMAFAPKIKAKVARALASSEKTHAAAAQALEKAGLARSYGSQSVLDELVSAKSRQEKEFFRRQALASDAALSLQNGLLAVFAVSLFAIGFSDMRSGAVTPGAFAALIGVGASLFGQLKTLAFAFDLVASSSRALAEHVRFLREVPDAPRLSSVEPRPCAALILSDWKVERAGKVVVDVPSLCLDAGEKLYLAGASGAGKSSLLLSILGQAPSSGAMAWGEGAWRVGDSGVCAHMPQDSSSMGGTVRDNLRLGNPSAGDVEMWDALSTAGLRGKIEGLGGLDAEIAWKGSNLSGGEAQRLSLARAMLSGMPLLLLDEPTSGLDAFSEMAAISAISSLSDRSAIICVHRLRAIPKASRVALMRDGKIVEDGPLEHLIWTGGEFSKMWQASESA